MRHGVQAGALRTGLPTWGWVLPVVGLGAACLPNPQSVRERREAFDHGRYVGKVLLAEVPETARKIGVVFGHQIELAAVELEPAEPKQGDRVQVTYYWRALEPVARDFQVFVHGDALEGSDRRLHGDHWPAGGAIPTGVWRPGEVVKDRFLLAIPGSYAGRRLGLYTGLYRGEDRLRITDRGSVEATSDHRALAVQIDL